MTEALKPHRENKFYYSDNAPGVGNRAAELLVRGVSLVPVGDTAMGLCGALITGIDWAMGNDSLSESWDFTVKHIVPGSGMYHAITGDLEKAPGAGSDQKTSGRETNENHQTWQADNSSSNDKSSRNKKGKSSRTKNNRAKHSSRTPLRREPSPPKELETLTKQQIQVSKLHQEVQRVLAERLARGEQNPRTETYDAMANELERLAEAHVKATEAYELASKPNRRSRFGLGPSAAERNQNVEEAKNTLRAQQFLLAEQLDSLTERFQTLAEPSDRSEKTEDPSSSEKSDAPPPVPPSDSESEGSAGPGDSPIPALKSASATPGPSSNEESEELESASDGSDYAPMSTSSSSPLSGSNDQEPPPVPPHEATPPLPPRDNGSSSDSDVPDMPMAGSSTAESSENDPEMVDEYSQTYRSGSESTSDDIDPQWEAEFGQTLTPVPTLTSATSASPSTPTADVASIIASSAATNRALAELAANKQPSSEAHEDTDSWSD